MNTRLATIVLVLILSATMVEAQVPRFLNHQGFLTNTVGVALDTTLTITYRLFNDSTGGVHQFTQTFSNVQVARGVFRSTLGSIPLPFDRQYWLEVQAGTEVITPRTRLTSAAYSLRADTANSVSTTAALSVSSLTTSGGAAIGGTAQVGSFRLPTGAVLGRVLTSDGTGIGSWQVLPPGVGGSGSAGQAAFWSGTSSLLGNSNFFWDNTNFRLGLGTITPAQRLDVVGTARMTGFQLPTGAAAGFVLTSDASGVGAWASSVAGSGTANYLAKFTAGTTVGNSAIYETGGNVGIGTTGATQMLSLTRAADFSLQMEHTGTGGRIWQISNIGGTTPGFRIFDGTANLERLRIDASGNVGIGTTSPSVALHVNRDGRALLVDGAAIINTTSFRGLGFQYYFGSGEGAIMASFPTGQGYLTFHTTTGGTMSERMRITPTGNVGIGTASPGYKLHVLNTVSDANWIGRFQNGSSDLYLAHGSGYGMHINTGNTSASQYALDITNGSTNIAYFRNDGRIGIGTTSPSTIGLLHVAGSDIVVDGTVYRGIVWASGNTYQAHMHRYGASNNALYVTNAGPSNLTGVYLASGATGWTSTSDRRFKENIRDATYGLDAVLRIPVREFTFKDSKEKKKIGFIAQEIYPIIPEIVDKGDDGEYSGPAATSAVPSSFVPWGVDYAGLTPILVKSVQEQQRMIETLSKQLDEEREKNQGLESRLRALEKKLDAGR